MTVTTDAVTQDELVRANTYFVDYVRFVHRWEFRRHQKRWAEALQLLADGFLRHPQKGRDCPACVDLKACSSKHATYSLLILAFPGSGKTMTVCQWVAWLIGRATMMGEPIAGGLVCNAEPVALLRSVKGVRDILEFNPRYKQVFPLVVPDESKWSAGQWFLRRADTDFPWPVITAVGMDSVILSYRWPHFTVVDDPHGQTRPLPTARAHVGEKWTVEISTRGHEETPRVMIATRHASDDLPGRVMKQESGWVVLITPAEDEFGESAWPFEVVNGVGMGISTEALQEIKRVDYSGAYLTQFQCKPPSEGGGYFQYFPFLYTPPRQDQVAQVIQSWDTAAEAKDVRRGSYNVMVQGVRLKDGRVYIDHVYRARKSPVEVYEDCVRLFETAQQRYGAGKVLVLVEDASTGQSLVSFLRAYTPIGPYVTGYRVPGLGKGSGKPGRGDPVNRAAAVTNIFAAGSVLLPATWTSWRDEYIEELSSFPYGEHNDQVVATVQLLEYVYPTEARGMPPEVTVDLPWW